MAKQEVLTNFIPISRKLFEHRFWCEERVYSKFEAWIDLIQFARFEDEKRDFGSKVIAIKRGQCLASTRFLSNRWGWSRTKVETFLKLLEDDKMIEKSHQKDIGQTFITICNYNSYNMSKKHENPQKVPPQSHPKATPKPNNNKENKENNIPPYIPPKGYDDFDFSFLSFEFRDCMTRWLDYKRTKRQKYKSAESLLAFYNKMIEGSGNMPAIAMKMIDESMSNNWDGLFPLKQKGVQNEAKQNNPPRKKEYTAF